MLKVISKHEKFQIDYSGFPSDLTTDICFIVNAIHTDMKAIDTESADSFKLKLLQALRYDSQVWTKDLSGTESSGECLAISKATNTMTEQECLDWVLDFLRNRKAMFDYSTAKGWCETYMEENGIHMTDKEKQAWISGMVYGDRNALDDAIELLENNGFDC